MAWMSLSASHPMATAQYGGVRRAVHNAAAAGASGCLLPVLYGWRPTLRQVVAASPTATRALHFNRSNNDSDEDSGSPPPPSSPHDSSGSRGGGDDGSQGDQLLTWLRDNNRALFGLSACFAALHALLSVPYWLRINRRITRVHIEVLGIVHDHIDKSIETLTAYTVRVDQVIAQQQALLRGQRVALALTLAAILDSFLHGGGAASGSTGRGSGRNG